MRGKIISSSAADWTRQMSAGRPTPTAAKTIKATFDTIVDDSEHRTDETGSIALSRNHIRVLKLQPTPIRLNL